MERGLAAARRARPRRAAPSETGTSRRPRPLFLPGPARAYAAQAFLQLL